MLLQTIEIKQNSNGYFYMYMGEFCLSINWFRLKTGLSEKDLINVLINIYNGEHAVFVVRFKYKEDAQAALDWIESMLLARYLVKGRDD